MIVQDHQTWILNVAPWLLETHLFLGQRSKVKVTRLIKPTFVCLSICLFIHMISQKSMQLGSPTITKLGVQMFHDECWKPTYFDVKGQSQRSKVKVTTSVSVFSRCCVRKPRRVFPAVMPRRTSNNSDTGFSVRHFPAYACRWALGFLRRGSLHSCECWLLRV